MNKQKPRFNNVYEKDSNITLCENDRMYLLDQLPDCEAELIITSPPYNINKIYEKNKLSIDDYLIKQEETIGECVRVLADNGSICYQLGNHITKAGDIVPLDILLYPLFKKFGLFLRGRIIWRFGHGLHCSKRFSGRYETIMWFTKTKDHIFNLDPVRVPQKYPNKKHYKGKKKGELSCNPKGKNPSDIWDIPNVKHNHTEKTIHPCQFPIELVSRLVLSLTNEGGLVVDPYMGVGSSLCAAVINNRRGAGSEICTEYIKIAEERIKGALEGNLKFRGCSN